MTERLYFDRSWPLEGIEILSRGKGGDGRTVEAYAAIFDTPTEIVDQYGHYMERNDKSAFNMTINSGAAMRSMVLYNHGRSVVNPGQADSLAQVPIGRPLEIRADSRGLLTVSRYNKSALADAVLEAIRNDDIRSQSYRGRIYRSDPGSVPRGGFKPGPDGQLTSVTRMEMGLTDYGPTPVAAYEGAAILAVRSAQRIMQDIAVLTEDERAELIRMLATTPGAPEPATATVAVTAGTEGPRKHSGRIDLLRLKAEAVFAGVDYAQAVRGVG
jgi:Caudovirus prohead serine protease